VPADLHPIGRNYAINQQVVNGFLPVGVSHFVGKEKKTKNKNTKQNKGICAFSMRVDLSNSLTTCAFFILKFLTKAFSFGFCIIL